MEQGHVPKTKRLCGIAAKVTLLWWERKGFGRAGNSGEQGEDGLNHRSLSSGDQCSQSCPTATSAFLVIFRKPCGRSEFWGLFGRWEIPCRARGGTGHPCHPGSGFCTQMVLVEGLEISFSLEREEKPCDAVLSSPSTPTPASSPHGSSSITPKRIPRYQNIIPRFPNPLSDSCSMIWHWAPKSSGADGLLVPGGEQSPIEVIDRRPYLGARRARRLTAAAGQELPSCWGWFLSSCRKAALGNPFQAFIQRQC